MNVSMTCLRWMSQEREVWPKNDRKFQRKVRTEVTTSKKTVIYSLFQLVTFLNLIKQLTFLNFFKKILLILIISVLWFFYVLKANWQNLRCCTQMFRGNGRGSSRLRSSTWGFAFSKIQNSTFTKLCPPSKGNLLMGNFSGRLTQNEIYFPNFHQYMQSQKWKLQCIAEADLGGGCRGCAPPPPGRWPAVF